MTPLARGYSFVMYLAKGLATYTIPFPYLRTDDLRVFAGDVGDAVEQSFTWIGSTEIQLAAEVPEGILVTIRRFTPRDDTLAVYHDGAQLPARDLNLNTKQLLYICQEQLDFGMYGGGGLPGGGSGWPNPGGQPSLPIQQIIDQLMQSPVMGLLVGRLDEIDNTAETMLEEILRSDQLFDNRRALEQRTAFVETTIEIIQDDTKSLAKQTTELYAQYDKNAAQIIDVREALATETEARATAITQLNAAIDGSESNLTEVRQALANEAEARTTSITKAYADFKDADGAVTKAVNENLSTNYATKNYAQSIAQTQVEAWAAGNYAILQQRFEALVKGSADPGGSPEWQANYTVRINGGAINGVPVIAGMGLGVDSKTGSNFVIMADRFAFVSPTYTTSGGVAQMKYPFVIGTVGGVSTVGIQGQLVVDGSITADKIRVNSLSALTANMGEVNGGTFRTFQLDGNGNIINPLEFRAEMTNNPGDYYPFWLGTGAKNWNNAVFAVDRAGNAKFSGQITAQNMIGNLQVANTWNWTGDITASGGVTASFVLDAPVRLGETHRPVMMLEMQINNNGGDPCNGTIIVEKLIGSSWVAMRSNNYYLGAYNNQVSTILVLDDPTAATQFYRIRTASGGNRDGNFHLLRASGYAFGLR